MVVAIAGLLILLFAVGYFIRIGKQIKKSQISDEVIDDIQKIYKMEAREEEILQEKLDGKNISRDSIASVFPNKLRNPSHRRRAAKDIQ